MNEQQKQICQAIVNVFESGSPVGKYSSVTYSPKDAGHLSYGRSQVSLASGNLSMLLKRYVEAPDAEFAHELQPYMGKVLGKDFSLDTDMAFRSLLKQAGQDPAMQREQDGYFDQNYYQPAVRAATRADLQLPLSVAVVYDTHIQSGPGGWNRLAARVNTRLGGVGPACTEQSWVNSYVETRRAYLRSLSSLAAATTYRMDTFTDLIGLDNWDLNLSLKAHGVQITDAIFTSTPAPPPPLVRASVPDPELDDRPILHPAIPYLRGAAVTDLQTHLNSAGFRNAADGVYGPFTQVLTRQFQARAGLKADAVVGPMTWRELLQPVAGG